MRRQEAEWLRSRLLEAYSNAIHYFMKLGMSATRQTTEDPNVRLDYAEAHRHLLLLLRAFTSDAEAIRELTKCSYALDNNCGEKEKLAAVADACCLAVGKLLRNDPRVQPAEN